MQIGEKGMVRPKYLTDEFIEDVSEIDRWQKWIMLYF